MTVNSLTENPPAMDCTIGSKSSIIVLKKEEMLGLDSLLSSIIENGIFIATTLFIVLSSL